MNISYMSDSTFFLETWHDHYHQHLMMRIFRAVSGPRLSATIGGPRIRRPTQGLYQEEDPPTYTGKKKYKRVVSQKNFHFQLLACKFPPFICWLLHKRTARATHCSIQ